MDEIISQLKNLTYTYDDKIINIQNIDDEEI
jgi:hypothetical protein